ncbi:DUF4440 domain-containing protein [Rhizobium leguminosarum]|uniref:DUF4440 domain-containing protein n=1 Tax=Rhizobium leguminosarum TaxID=384 RepID=UPI000A3E7CD5|nr:DUF4440 domain-containing protein [Rhizobium leguminosarum]
MLVLADVAEQAGEQIDIVDIRVISELTMSDFDLETILGELRQREPIFNRRDFGTSRDDLEAMTAEDFFEIGASGRIYRRGSVIANLLECSKQSEGMTGPAGTSRSAGSPKPLSAELHAGRTQQDEA